MARSSTTLLAEAMKLPIEERVRVAEKLLESVDTDAPEEGIDSAWASEVQRRSQELREGTVRGLSVDEARRLIAADDE
jgi:putative addiction module component (TIGR02574 family)